MSGSATAPAQTSPVAPAPPAHTLAPSDYTGHIEQAMQRAASIRAPQPPALQKLPQPAEFKPESPAAGLQTWGTVLATLGSLLTRAPLASALRAAAASMQAYQQGSIEGYRINRLQFSDKLNQALAENQQETQHYQQLIEQSRFDMQGALAEIQGYAALRHDQVMMQVADINAAARLTAARMEAGARLAAVNAQVAENERTNQVKLVTSLISQGYNVPNSVLQEYGMAGPQAADPKPGDMPGRPSTDPTTGEVKSAVPGVMSLQEALRTGPLSPALENTAWAIANYQTPMGNALSSFGGNLAARARVIAEVMRINPKFNAKIYHAQQGALDYYYHGQGSNLIRSYSTAVYHMDSLRQLADALGNTNQPLGNYLINWARRAYGNPNITNFDVAKTLVAGELTTALRGSQGAEADIKRFEDELSANMTPAQLRGALATVAKLLNGRLGVIDRQIKDTTGLDEGAQLIPPEVRQSLNALEEATKGSQVPASGPIPMGEVPQGWQWGSRNGGLFARPDANSPWQPVQQ